MIAAVKKFLELNGVNYQGWSTNRKLIIFESDDWGSIRMSGKTAYAAIKSLGVALEKSPYCLYDCLEKEEDLHILFDLLLKFQDHKERTPVITANVVVGNPDFEKIKHSEYRQYHYEPFTSTYARHKGSEDVISCFNDGIQQKIIVPQFHGREHVNTGLWLRLLQEGDPVFL